MNMDLPVCSGSRSPSKGRQPGNPDAAQHPDALSPAPGRLEHDSVALSPSRLPQGARRKSGLLSQIDNATALNPRQQLDALAATRKLPSEIQRLLRLLEADEKACKQNWLCGVRMPPPSLNHTELETLLEQNSLPQDVRHMICLHSNLTNSLREKIVEMPEVTLENLLATMMEHPIIDGNYGIKRIPEAFARKLYRRIHELDSNAHYKDERIHKWIKSITEKIGKIDAGQTMSHCMWLMSESQSMWSMIDCSEEVIL